MNNIISEPKLSALLYVIHQGIVMARFNALECSKLINRISGEKEKMVSDLMDAIHNIPTFINNAEEWNEEFCLSHLKSFDDKWTRKIGFSLMKCYEETLAGNNHYQKYKKYRKANPS